MVSTVNQLKTGFDSDTAIAFQSPVTLNAKPAPIAGFVLQKTAVDNPPQIVMKQVLPKTAKATAQAQPSGQLVSPQAIAAPQHSEKAERGTNCPAAKAVPNPPIPSPDLPEPIPEPKP